jgi:hypothetical protein
LRETEDKHLPAPRVRRFFFHAACTERYDCPRRMIAAMVTGVLQTSRVAPLVNVNTLYATTAGSKSKVSRFYKRSPISLRSWSRPVFFVGDVAIIMSGGAI